MAKKHMILDHEVSHTLEVGGNTLAILTPKDTLRELRLPDGWTSIIEGVIDEHGERYDLDFSGEAPVDPTCRMEGFDGKVEQIKVFGRRLVELEELEWLVDAYAGSILDFMREKYDPTTVAYEEPESMMYLIVTLPGSRGEIHTDVSDGNFNLYGKSDDAEGGNLMVWANPREVMPIENPNAAIVIPVQNGSSSLIGNSLDTAERLPHGVEPLLAGLRWAINMNYETKANAGRDRSSINEWDGNT